MNAEALLDAGAVLPAGAEVTKDDTVDTLTARAYRHPALEDRVVVRLVPGTLGGAEDLGLEFLQFGAPERVDEVGLVRQQALGFPAWALVHDPANGHHALALVKDIEKLARTAKSRVGPANDGFVALGERLARSVPHFLPTFYEEAGRAFLAADSPSYAATMFGRARDAERSYGLAIDEDRTHAVFLEFALAGALSAKALSAHARDLAARCEPAAAYDRFRRLCVERTLGGLPPYAGMHTDLRRLAKASGLDQQAADGMVLAGLLDAPAALRAPAAFWTAYQTSLGKLGAADPAVRDRLLSLFPANCADELWLSILEGAGALAALTDAPHASPADWLTRFAAHRENRSWRDTKRLPELLALVERLAPRLVADGIPVVLAGETDDVDLDLLDACLAAGVPVADPHVSSRLPVGHWFGDDTDGRRDLAALGADPRFRTALGRAVEASFGAEFSTAGIERVLAVPGLRAALHGWLGMMADRVVRQGLPTLGGELDRLKRVASPAGFAVNPEAVRRVTTHDLGPVLGRTLRAGVLDEYGWPAWEEALRRLPVPTDDGKLDLAAQWPVLVVHGGKQAIVVGTEGIEAEYPTPVPAGKGYRWWRLGLRYVDGALLVCWYSTGSGWRAYWSTEPDDVFAPTDDGFGPRGFSVPLPDGGRTAGGRPLRAGDRGEQQVGPVATDGASYWVLSTVDGTATWREYDPATGTPGRVSLPRFFEAGAVDGQPLKLDGCYLMPAYTVPQDSPLGRADGLVGWRVRAGDDGTVAGEGIDGRAFTLTGAVRDAGTGLSGQLSGALRFPGSDVLYGVLRQSGWHSESVTLCTADGFPIGQYALGTVRQPFARGTATLPPLPYWHHLRPRDPGGSAALRTLTDAQATTLLTGALGLDRAGVRALVAQALPALTDPALLDGVAGIVKLAAKRAARLRTFATVLSGQSVYPKAKKGAEPAPVPAGPASDAALTAALGDLLHYCRDRGHSGVGLVDSIASALTAPELPTGTWLPAEVDSDWSALVKALPVAMYRAVLPQTPPEQREALLALLETYAGSGLAQRGGRVRRVDLNLPKGTPSPKQGTAIELGTGRFLVMQVWGQYIHALEYAPDGRFTAPPDVQTTIQWTVELPAGAGELVRLVRENGPPQWPAELPARLAQAVGVSHAEATYLLAGLRVEDGTLSQTLREAAGAAWTATGLWVELIGLLLPADPATLWTEGPALDRLADWHTQAYGRRTPVRDELLELAQRAGFSGHLSASELLHGIANPDTCRWLAGTESYADAVTVAVAKGLVWLGYHLPADDPLRSVLPGVAVRARALLVDPDRAVPVGYLEEKKVDRFISALGMPVNPGPDWIEVGPLLVEAHDELRTVQVRPGLLSGADDPVLGALAARLGDVQSEMLAAVRLVLSGRLGAETSTVDSADPRDPSRCAPELVAEVAGKLGLSGDAASAYLQILALPDPTDRNVARWTGWKPARLAAARKELAPLLTLDEDGGSALDLVVPVAPLPELFTLAWQRITGGDTPRFDELSTTERRR
ncbi:MAG: hypothetical protein E6G35_00770 [Actinobacteria bacterium]|nr:MAG: hypothetical protein E6G35_00770 [Actinomycetota bacterium]